MGGRIKEIDLLGDPAVRLPVRRGANNGRRSKSQAMIPGQQEGARGTSNE